MSLRTIASFAVAIFFGLIAVALVRGVLSSRPATGGAARTTPVVVAIAPIEPGAQIKPAMVKVVNYPRDAVPAGSFRSPEQLFGNNAPPHTAQHSIAQNAPVLPTELDGTGARTTLSGVIQPGMRAVSLRSSDVAGVGGFVLPGDRVDILLTRTEGAGDAARTLTQVLAQNALVLGVDQTSDQTADKPIVAKAVTVEVTPEQAQTISLGQSVGELSLALRQSTDNLPVAKRLTTAADLAGPPAPRPRPAMRARPSGLVAVRVVRGVDATPYPVGTR
jgi:pilus assembly protein CpaB